MASPAAPPFAGTRGVALPLAVFALVVVGALVAGAFFVGRQEQAVGRSSVKLQQAFGAAEAGAQQTVAEWAAHGFTGLVPGDSAGFRGDLGAAGWYRGTVRRLNEHLFLVRSEGFSRDSVARQHVGLLVRLRPVELEIRAALESAGAVLLEGAPSVDGRDSPPAGWPCDSAGPAAAAVVVPSATALAGAGCPGRGCLRGTPAVLVDTSVAAPEIIGLRALATHIVAPGAVLVGPVVRNQGCDRTVLSNWGSPEEPEAPCGAFFPVVWAEGDLVVTGAQGQGVLLVNGDLTIRGGFAFYGPVVVRGHLRLEGSARIVGGAVTGSTTLAGSESPGGASVTFSRCTTGRAQASSATAVLLRERSWVNLY